MFSKTLRASTLLFLAGVFMSHAQAAVFCADLLTASSVFFKAAIFDSFQALNLQNILTEEQTSKEVAGTF